MADINYVNGFYTGNQYLSQEQRDNNAIWIAAFLCALPDTPWHDDRNGTQALAALIGNADIESTVNPGLWESRTVNSKKGFGLFQWTPATKYLDWCKSTGMTPNYMDAALMRLRYEWTEQAKADQWIPLAAYDRISFKEFAENAMGWDEEKLALCFCDCYERPSTDGRKPEQRQERADYYFHLLRDEPWIPSPDPTPPGHFAYPSGKWWMWLRRRKR